MSTQSAVADKSIYMFERAAESMPRSELNALQLSRLKTTVERAYHKVPHYKKKFDAAGVKPADLNSLADLARFPFTVKADLRDNYPFGMFAVPREQLLRVHASSGTTGKPTVVGYTKGDLDTWANLMARCFACAGALPGDIVHNAYGYGLFTGGLGAHYGAERLGCTVVPISGGGTERQVTLINDFKASVLCATPSYALNIAEIAQKMGVDLKQSVLARRPVRGGAVERRHAPRSRSPAWDQGGRCLRSVRNHGAGRGLRMSWGPVRACMAGKIISCSRPSIRKRMQPLPVGSTGELVITTLTKEAQPMIRYRTRDITRLSNQPCACGRTHVRILRVTGRNDDMLIIRGVNVYPSQVEAVLVGFPGIAPHYQIVLTREGALDAMIVEVELAPDFAGDRFGKADEVTHHIKSLIGVTCKVVVKAEGEVPRSQGKAVRVVDRRNKTN